MMRFLGMAGYYRKFCNNFSVIAEPLTNLLGKRVKFVWTDNCQKSFEKLKAILKSAPVLLAPNFDKEFKLAVDASDVGAGSVLLQVDDNGVDHPVCYYSKKFNKHQRNYSTIEKECLSLILALQHFEVYLASSVAPIVIFTDHNPLTFIHKMKKTRTSVYSDGVSCCKSTIQISGILKEKIISSQMHSLWLRCLSIFDIEFVL